MMVNHEECQQKQAEIWLLTELNQAEQNFGEGEDISEFAKEFKLAEYSDC